MMAWLFSVRWADFRPSFVGTGSCTDRDLIQTLATHSKLILPTQLFAWCATETSVRRGEGKG